MGKSGRKHHGKHGSKGFSGSKGSGGSKGSNEERRARKAAGRRSALDRAHLLSFGAALRTQGFELYEVEADGNCFFRSLADQLQGAQHAHPTYRQRVLSYMESHEETFVPFLTFGEGDEEDDADYEAYVERMRRDGEWAGQPELLAAAHALKVDLIVHQEA